MPPTTMSLQSQYPLSPRKFWKKIIEKLLGLVPVVIIFVILFSIVLASTNGDASILSLIVTFSAPASLVLLIGFILYGWYVSAYIRRYYYDATDSYITIKKGVFAPAEIHVQYSKIQDVYVDQDILDRMMGLYDVHLASATAASSIGAHIDGVDAVGADGLKNFLLQKLQNDGSATPLPMGPIPTVSSSMPSEPVAFTSEISSRTYPITGAWVTQQVVSQFFLSLVYTAFISFFILSKSSANMESLLFPSIGIFAVLYVSGILYQLLWRSTYSFGFLPDYIVTKQGIIAKRENHLPYRSVQDVTVSQDIVGRMLGIATVRIENAAAGQVSGKSVISSAVLIPGQPLEKANEISSALRSITLTKNSSQTGL